jgi:hypothetical protein
MEASMQTIGTIVIPTTTEKFPWLKTTLRGLALQEGVLIKRVVLVVDLKPWDSKDSIKGIEEITHADEDIAFEVDVDVMRPPMKPKRSHQAVNKAIGSLGKEGNQQILVMDDDYWFKTRSGLAELAKHSTNGVFVSPAFFDEVYVEEKENWLPKPVLEEGNIRYFHGNPRSDRIVCDLSERGQHPMCGHPKIFFIEDFMCEKGFDTTNFQHYWWCDTDMYYRLKKRFDFVQVPVETWHMNHPRYHPQMFQKPNAARFLEQHRAIGEISKTHLDALYNQLVE